MNLQKRNYYLIQESQYVLQPLHILQREKSCSSLSGNDRFIIRAFIEASQHLFPDRNIEYCDDTDEIINFINRFKNPEQYRTTEAHIVASSGSHYYLLDLYRHKNGQITAIVIDPSGIGPHYASSKQYAEYAALFGENKSTYISMRVLSVNQGCTIFSVYFALCSSRNRDHFTRIHQGFLEGIKPQRKDLPVAMFKHIQSSDQINKLKEEGLLGIESIALRRNNFEKNDFGNSIAYQRKDYAELAFEYWNFFPH